MYVRIRGDISLGRLAFMFPAEPFDMPAPKAATPSALDQFRSPHSLRSPP